jgi:lactoylglutathione lyase
MDRVIPMLYVSDVSRSTRFYQEAVGATCDHADDDGSYAELTLGSLVMGVVQVEHARRHFPGEFRRHDASDMPAAFELYVEVDDLGAAVARALEAGATQLSEPTERPWGQTNAFLRDPDGVVIELATAPK